MRDSAAKNYLTFFKGNETEIEHRNILRLTKFTPSCRVLEIGAGTGRITERYAALTTLTIASDYSFESLREQQKRTPPPILERIQLVQADGTALPFRDAAFDRVLSAGVLMHIPGAEMRDRFLAEASRVLLPNGLAVITGKNYSLYYQWMEYKREGRSEHGVITYSSTKAEYVNLLRKHFHVHDCLGFRYEIPKLTKYIGQPLLLDRLLQHMPLSSYCARAFIAQCSKTAPDMP